MPARPFTDSLGYVALLTILIWSGLAWWDAQLSPGRVDGWLARLVSPRILAATIGGLVTMLVLRHILLRRRVSRGRSAGADPRAT